MAAKIMNRDQAYAFLASRGVPITRHTLTKLASEGAGPPFHLVDGRAVYTVESLEEWARRQLACA